MRIQLASLACCAGLLAAINPARADTLTDLHFPAAFGFSSAATVSGSNPQDPTGKSAGYPGGITASYTIDASPYSQLYFGLEGINIGQNGGAGTFNLTTINAADFNTGTMTWTGNVTIDVLIGSQIVPETATAVFTATLLNGGTWINPTTVGIPASGAPSAVTNVTGNFQVSEAFTVNVNGGEAYSTWYNSFNTDNITSHVGTNGDFWGSPAAAVPGPILGGGGPGLILAGGGLLGWLLRKRRETATV